MPRFDTCPKCKSSRIATKLAVFEDNGNYKSSFEAAKIGYFAKPDALILKEKVMSDFSADACTDCGYLEFYLETPSAFADRVELETSKEPEPQSSKPS